MNMVQESFDMEEKEDISGETEHDADEDPEEEEFSNSGEEEYSVQMVHHN